DKIAGDAWGSVGEWVLAVLVSRGGGKRQKNGVLEFGGKHCA
nr:hypothetical protein [Tanacetum cinerariifolium]